ncbi:MAG TPA: phosphotransferase [Patescibacteria group bacterium]|nr:phosphotransferase [Patescibacteria group bacterium]
MNDELRELVRVAIALAAQSGEGVRGPGIESQTLARGGSDRHFIRLTDGTRSVVALLQPGGGGEFERYLAIGDFLNRLGVGVPTFHASDRARGVLLMEDLGDTHLEDALTGCGEARELALYRECLGVLTTLQTSVTDAMARENLLNDRRFDGEVLLGETAYFEREFVAGYAGTACPPGWEHERRMLAGRLAGEPAVFMHRDFQSRNIMIKEGRVRIVDFQTAHRGPGLYDAASLLKDPYHPLPAATRKRLLREFHRELRSAGSGVTDSFDRFHDAFLLAGIQRNCQALAAYAFLGRTKGKEQFLESIPPALRLLEEGIEEYGGFPALRSLVRGIRQRNVKGML